jgi:hypothetical protein
LKESPSAEATPTSANTAAVPTGTTTPGAAT